MKRSSTCFILLLLLLIFPFCAQEKLPPAYGSLEGNVFWKYNNYVGNKPDAGSEIYLFGVDDSTLRYEAKADLRGDFSFDSIPTGRYILLCQSENTNDNPASHLRNLYFNRFRLRSIVDSFPFEKLDSVWRKVDDYESRARSMIIEKGDFLRRMQKERKLKDTADDIAGEFIKNLPTKIAINIGIITGYSNKIDLQDIKIDTNRKTTAIVDFKTTYM